MPKTSTKFQKKATTTPYTTTPTLVIFKHASRRILDTRPKTYQLAVDAALRHFPHIPRGAISLKTNELDICHGEYVDITPKCWGAVIGLITSIEVVQDGELTPGSSRDDSGAIKLLLNFNGRTTSVKTKRNLLFENFHQVARRRFGVKADDMRFLYDGQCATIPEYSSKTLGEMGMRDGDEVVALSQGGRRHGLRKPVIYLFSPEVVDATLTLSLIHEWRFSVVYPVVPIKHSDNGHEVIRWDVQTHIDGSLTEKNTGLDVSYLFWEARVNSEVPPPAPIENFSTLSDVDSVVLHVDTITPYLDKALTALGLHTEARTSFITYWLPSLSKRKHVALRFLPQSTYARAAPLEVSPKPDIITRIFMLFQGVPSDRLPEWPTAVAKAEDGRVDWWTGVVGVDVERALDTRLFRVLEWGGMEVETL